ncbi:hypothetical protein CCP3SC1AL1_520023 [Gammaproteobacteria bacterium]
MTKLTEKELKKMLKEMEENPYHKLFEKDKIPRCYVCGKKYKKVKPYLWKGCCKHIPRNLILAVG